MKFSTALSLSCLLAPSVSGFTSNTISFTRPQSQVQQTPTQSCARIQPLFATSTASRTTTPAGTIPADSPVIQRAADNVLTVAQDCFDNSSSGVFLAGNVEASEKLKKAVNELEAVSSAMKYEPADIVGDWRLIVTTSKTNPTFGSSKKRPQSKLIKTNRMSDNNILQKAVKVVQRIRQVDVDEKDKDVAVAFNRVDNIIEIAPPAVLEEIQSKLDKSPLKKWIPTALNPLEVTRQTISLVHKARIEDSGDVLRTKISLQSIILNLAGKTQYLEKDGADILGLNFPFGDLLQSGSFDTTYVDDKIRISRGTIGMLDELRVFVKIPDMNSTLRNVSTSEELEDVLKSPEQSQAEDDVDAALDLAKEDMMEDKLESVIADKASFEDLAKETSVEIAEELRSLSIPAVADAVDGAFNATFGKTPTEAIGDATKETASKLYEAGEQVLEGIEDAIDFVEKNVTSAIPSASTARRNATAMALDMRSNVDSDLANAVDKMVNATVGKTPLQIIQDAAGDAAEGAKDVAEDVVDALEDAEDAFEELEEDAAEAMVNVNQTMVDVEMELEEMEKEEAKKNKSNSTETEA